jgi:hypothetical protein
MKLPKIKNENLPEELKKLLGDQDAEFDSIVDINDIISVDIDQDVYEKQKLALGKKLMESRKKQQELLKQKKMQERNT